MKNKFKLLSILTSACLLASSVQAKSDMPGDNDYESNFYAAEGSILFKLRAMGIMSKSKAKNFPPAINKPGVSAGHFISNGYGAEGTTTIFFTDNIGAELGLGLAVFRTSGSASRAAQVNYGNGKVVLKRKDVYGIPLSLMAQYHIAPFGAIDPYVGLGYQGMYFFTKSREYKIGNSHGPAFQVGLDFKLRDDTVFNIDVKRYNLQPKLTYTNKFLGRPDNLQPISGKVKIDPVIVSVGLGFKF
jgi:outer membrane protein